MQGIGICYTPTQFQPEGDESLPSHSSSSSEWESDVSVGVLFKILFINMTLINQLEHKEAIEMFDAEPGLSNSISSGRSDFKQHEPPTEDRLIQVDVSSRDHTKPISISESLSLTEREELIALIREYIDVFA